MSEREDYDQFLVHNLRKSQPYVTNGFSAKVVHRLRKHRRRERWFFGLQAIAITALVI